MNRQALQNFLLKLGFPNHFVSPGKSFRDDKEACVNIGGIFTESFKAENDVNQGGVLGTTFVSSVVMANAFKDCSQGIYVTFTNAS